MLRSAVVITAGLVSLVVPTASDAPKAAASSTRTAHVAHALKAVELADCTTRVIRKPSYKVETVCYLPDTRP